MKKTTNPRPAQSTLARFNPAHIQEVSITEKLIVSHCAGRGVTLEQFESKSTIWHMLKLEPAATKRLRDVLTAILKAEGQS